MNYKVIITEDAENDLDRYVWYLLYEKENKQAAKAVLDDFEETVGVLAKIADSIKLCDNPRLRQLGYRRMHFQRHRYFMLYRIEDGSAVVDAIFHELQDYENKMI